MSTVTEPIQIRSQKLQALIDRCRSIDYYDVLGRRTRSGFTQLASEVSAELDVFRANLCVSLCKKTKSGILEVPVGGVSPEAWYAYLGSCAALSPELPKVDPGHGKFSAIAITPSRSYDEIGTNKRLEVHFEWLIIDGIADIINRLARKNNFNTLNFGDELPLIFVVSCHSNRAKSVPDHFLLTFGQDTLVMFMAEYLDCPIYYI